MLFRLMPMVDRLCSISIVTALPFLFPVRGPAPQNLEDEYTGPKAGEQGGQFPSVEPIVAQNLPFLSFFLNVNTCKLFTMCS